MNITYRQIDEANMLFEIIKTILITWLSHKKIKKLLNKYTHHEIRQWKSINNNFIISDLIIHDGEFAKKDK
jgi:hypothetical protein